LGIGTSHSYSKGFLKVQYQEIVLLKIFCRSDNLARSLRVIFSLGIGTSHSYNTGGFKGMVSGDCAVENLLKLRQSGQITAGHLPLDYWNLPLYNTGVFKGKV
jgi:hypothetical protein